MSISTPTTIGTAAGTLTTATSNSPLQITGLASGLNTNAIIQAELAESELPITNMQTEAAGLGTEDATLTSIQSALTTVQLDAEALGDPTLFSPSQGVTSSNPDLVTATSDSGVGSVIGGSVLTVTQLASSAQRTFTFASSQTSADTITIDGQQVSVAAKATSQDLANSINGNDNMDVWAAATSSGQIVLSSRTTGEQLNADGTPSSDYINVTDPGSTLAQATETETVNGVPTDVAMAQNGQNAEYTINGNQGSSPSDTVSDSTTGASLTMPGVTLTLNGVTGSDDPVTVAVQQPTANTATIEAAVNQFVTDYNTAINLINTTVSTQPAATSTGAYNPNSGSLFGDSDLEDIVDNMRTSIETPGTGLPTGLAALSDLGISTGSSTGSATQSSTAGDLTVNQSQLTAAIQSNPNGVEQVMEQFSSSFFDLADAAAGPSGALQDRIEGNSAEITSLDSQVTSMQALYNQQEQAMEAQWATVEATLSKLQSEGSAFTASTTAATAASDSSSSSSSL
ncbi:MAG: flagellar filament capping protein FliD [Solirubrobacteraceae bacterium]